MNIPEPNLSDETIEKLKAALLNAYCSWIKIDPSIDIDRFKRSNAWETYVKIRDVVEFVVKKKLPKKYIGKEESFLNQINDVIREVTW